jgi:hypothetical protein
VGDLAKDFFSGSYCEYIGSYKNNLLRIITISVEGCPETWADNTQMLQRAIVTSERLHNLKLFRAPAVAFGLLPTHIYGGSRE